MPLLIHNEIEFGAEVGVWKIEESEDFFRDKLPLIQIEIEQLDRIKGRRRTEWLAVRYLLHQMSGREIRGACLKDSFGKPYLEGSVYQISMSHTQGLAAIIAGPKPVGIDIQKKVSKIDRIAPKFVNEQEIILFDDLSTEILHVLWGAKECLYKAYGRKRLDFRKHIHIQPINISDGQGVLAGFILDDNQDAYFFDLTYEWIKEEVCMVWASQLST